MLKSLHLYNNFKKYSFFHLTIVHQLIIILLNCRLIYFNNINFTRSEKWLPRKKQKKQQRKHRQKKQVRKKLLRKNSEERGKSIPCLAKFNPGSHFSEILKELHFFEEKKLTQKSDGNEPHSRRLFTEWHNFATLCCFLVSSLRRSWSTPHSSTSLRLGLLHSITR